jgi:hypothetical protein
MDLSNTLRVSMPKLKNLEVLASQDLQLGIVPPLKTMPLQMQAPNLALP